MSPFIESIWFQQGQMPLLNWHQDRFTHTQRANWHTITYPDLKTCILQNAVMPTDNRKYKCRVLYGPDKIETTFTPYQPKTISNLRIVQAPLIDYQYKSADRQALNQLTATLPPLTEVLILQKGLLTDSSFSNLAFFDGRNWHTPSVPLLAGVHRKKLLDEKILLPRAIKLTDLEKYQKIRLINAMVSWEDTWELPISAIQMEVIEQ